MVAFGPTAQAEMLAPSRIPRLTGSNNAIGDSIGSNRAVMGVRKTRLHYHWHLAESDGALHGTIGAVNETFESYPVCWW